MAALLRGVRPMGAARLLRSRGQLAQQRRFPGPRHPGDHVAGLQLEVDRQLTQVVQAGVLHGEESGPRGPRRRPGHGRLAPQIRPRGTRQQQRIARFAQQPGRRPGEQHAAPIGPRPRTDVDDPVRGQHRLPIVLNHDHRVALIHQPPQDAQQPQLIPRMQPDRRLVQHVGDPAQARAGDIRQAEPLRLAAGQRGRVPVQGQVAQSQIQQQVGAPQDLLPDRPAGRSLRRLEFHVTETRAQLPDVQFAEPGDIPPGERHGQGPRIQPCPAARPARPRARKPQDVPVPVPLENPLHDRDDAPVVAGRARPGRDPAPLHPRFQGVLAEGNFDAVAAVEDHLPLGVGQFAPGDVHVEAMGPAHLVKHIHRHLGVDHVAAVGGNDQGAIAQRFGGIVDEQSGIDGVLNAQPAAGFAGARAVEGKVAAVPAPAIGRSPQPREQQPQVGVQFADRPHGGAGIARRRLLVQGDGRAQVVDARGIRLPQLAQQLPRPVGERFQVAALPLPAHRVEGQRRLPGPRDARDHHQRVVRDVHIHVTQVVGPRPADPDRGNRTRKGHGLSGE